MPNLRLDRTAPQDFGPAGSGAAVAIAEVTQAEYDQIVDITNTVYGFNTTITGAVSQTMADLALYADETAFSIIDDGGIDTVDFSGYAANQFINLFTMTP